MGEVIPFPLRPNFEDRQFPAADYGEPLVVHTGSISGTWMALLWPAVPGPDGEYILPDPAA